MEEAAAAAAQAEQEAAPVSPRKGTNAGNRLGVGDQSTGFERKASLHSFGASSVGSIRKVHLMRANSLPESDDDLRHAATMPGLMDVDADRPYCGGLWKTQQALGALLGVVLATFFLTVEVVTTYSKANAMIAVMCLTGCFWIFEVIPIYVTALLPAVLMPLLEVTSTEIAAGAYWNWVQLLFLGGYLISVAMEHVQLPRRLLLHVLMRTGTTRSWLVLLGFMLVAWTLSMVCSDIAITLMLAPHATSLVEAAEDEAAMHDTEKGSEVATGMPPSQADAGRGVREVRRFSNVLLLGIAYAASAGGIATTIGATPNALLAGQNLVAGHVQFGRWFAFALPISASVLVLAFGVLCASSANGARLPLSPKVLMEEHASLVREVGPFSRDELLVGLVQVLLLLLLCLQPLIDRTVTNPLGVPLSGSATTACLCATLLFLLPSKARRGEALLTWKVAQEKVPWGVMLLMGGGFSLAKGFQESGLTACVGETLAPFIPHMSCLELSFMITLAVIVLIQLMNNVVTAAWVLPCLASASVHSVTNPMRLLLPATIACSLSFMLPTASAANAIVLAKSRDLDSPLQLRHFLRSGLPLTLVAWATAALLSTAMGSAVFGADMPFPADVCVSRSLDCRWVFVPGMVEGRQVEGQACIPLDAHDGKVCRMWGGGLVNLSSADGTRSWGIQVPTAGEPELAPLPKRLGMLELPAKSALTPTR